MAEVKEEKERAIYKSTLEKIVERINENLKSEHIQNEIVVKEGRSIGILTFNKNQEAKSKKLYAITMVIDGKQFDYIYDETGDNIARVGANNEVFTDDDIQLEGEKLISNIKITDANSFNLINPNEKKLSDYEEPNICQYGIKPDPNAAIINLNTPYNGRRMIDYLGMDKKYNKLNYLGFIKSSELTAKDGKKRENEFVPVLMDDEKKPTSIIEIGKEYLTYRPDLSKYEQINADRTSDIYGDGEQIKGARTTTNTGAIDVFEFPNAQKISSDKSHVMTLHIRNKIDNIEKGVSPTDGNNIEAFIGRQYAGKTEHALQEGLDTHLTKLEATNEANRFQEFYSNIDRANDKGVRDVEADVYSSYERLADKIMNQFNGWDTIFDKETLIQRIQQLHESQVKEYDDQMVFNEIAREIAFRARDEKIETTSKNLNQVISNAIREVGLDRIPERDAIEINKIMQSEIMEQTNNASKESHISDSINSEITSAANEKAKYLDMAYKIAKNSNIYGIRDVYDEIMKMKSKNNKIDDFSLYKQVKEQIDGQRVLGDKMGGIA